MKWLKNEKDAMNLLKGSRLSLVMVAPEEACRKGKALEAAELLNGAAGAGAAVAFVDPMTNPDFCETHEVMHQFTVLAFVGGHEIERRRIGMVSDMKRMLGALIRPETPKSEVRTLRVADAQPALGHTA